MAVSLHSLHSFPDANDFLFDTMFLNEGVSGMANHPMSPIRSPDHLLDLPLPLLSINEVAGVFSNGGGLSEVTGVLSNGAVSGNLLLNSANCNNACSLLCWNTDPPPKHDISINSLLTPESQPTTSPKFEPEDFSFDTTGDYLKCDEGDEFGLDQIYQTLPPHLSSMPDPPSVTATTSCGPTEIASPPYKKFKGTRLSKHRQNCKDTANTYRKTNYISNPEDRKIFPLKLESNDLRVPATINMDHHFMENASYVPPPPGHTHKDHTYGVDPFRGFGNGDTPTGLVIDDEQGVEHDEKQRDFIKITNPNEQDPFSGYNYDRASTGITKTNNGECLGDEKLLNKTENTEGIKLYDRLYKKESKKFIDKVRKKQNAAALKLENKRDAAALKLENKMAAKTKIETRMTIKRSPNKSKHNDSEKIRRDQMKARFAGLEKNVGVVTKNGLSKQKVLKAANIRIRILRLQAQHMLKTMATQRLRQSILVDTANSLPKNSRPYINFEQTGKDQNIKMVKEIEVGLQSQEEDDQLEIYLTDFKNEKGLEVIYNELVEAMTLPNSSNSS